MKITKGKMGMKASLGILFFSAVLFVGVLPMPGHALTSAQVLDKVRESVVRVATVDAQGNERAQGSGVIFSSGKIATSCRIVEAGVSYRVGRGSSLLPAVIYAEDGDRDICLLSAKGIRGKAVELGKTELLKVGDRVHALGASEVALSDGVIVQLQGRPSPLIQTTAAVASASNGGALFDDRGRLIGLAASSSQDGQTLTFAVPVEWIREVEPGHKTTSGGCLHAQWAKRAIALETKQDWQGMLDWCRRWAKSEPKSGDVWFNLGVAYSCLNRRNDALGAYRQAVLVDPEHGDAWFALGAAYDAAKRYGAAMDAYRQAVTVEPESAKAWFGLGTVCSRLEKYDEAIEAYRRAVAIDPEYAKAWFGIGVAYSLSGNKIESMQAVDKLKSLDVAQADRLSGVIAIAMGERAPEKVLAAKR